MWHDTVIDYVIKWSRFWLAAFPLHIVALGSLFMHVSVVSLSPSSVIWYSTVAFALVPNYTAVCVSGKVTISLALHWLSVTNSVPYPPMGSVGMSSPPMPKRSKLWATVAESVPVSLSLSTVDILGTKSHLLLFHLASGRTVITVILTDFDAL